MNRQRSLAPSPPLWLSVEPFRPVLHQQGRRALEHAQKQDPLQAFAGIAALAWGLDATRGWPPPDRAVAVAGSVLVAVLVAGYVADSLG